MSCHCSCASPPTYLAGRVDRDGCALVDPARLAWGLARAAESLGVQIAEGTRVEDVTVDGGRVRVQTASGTVTAAHVVLATNAFRPLLARCASRRSRCTTTSWRRSR